MKKVLSLSIAILVIISVLVFVKAPQKLESDESAKNLESDESVEVGDWTELNFGDLKDTADYEFRSQSEGAYLVAAGDFDGNGVIDSAKFVVNTSGRYSLNISIKEWDGSVEEHYIDVGGFDEMNRLGIAPLPEGTYKTACAKGYGKCADDAKLKVILDHEAISLFTFESASSIIFWDGSKFEREFLSD